MLCFPNCAASKDVEGECCCGNSMSREGKAAGCDRMGGARSRAIVAGVAQLLVVFLTVETYTGTSASARALPQPVQVSGVEVTARRHKLGRGAGPKSRASAADPGVSEGQGDNSEASSLFSATEETPLLPPVVPESQRAKENEPRAPLVGEIQMDVPLEVRDLTSVFIHFESCIVPLRKQERVWHCPFEEWVSASCRQFPHRCCRLVLTVDGLNSFSCFADTRPFFFFQELTGRADTEAVSRKIRKRKKARTATGLRSRVGRWFRKYRKRVAKIARKGRTYWKNILDLWKLQLAERKRECRPKDTLGFHLDKVWRKT